VHADAGGGKAKFTHYYLRFHRFFPTGQNTGRIYEFDKGVKIPVNSSFI
jgi:hypothetical protein